MKMKKSMKAILKELKWIQVARTVSNLRALLRREKQGPLQAPKIALQWLREKKVTKTRLMSDERVSRLVLQAKEVGEAEMAPSSMRGTVREAA